MDNIETLSYMEIKAIASGNPRILKKYEIDLEIQILEDRQRNYRTTKYRLEENISKTIPENIQYTKKIIEELKNDINKIQEAPAEESCNLNFNNTICNTYKECGEAMQAIINGYMEINKEYEVGTYRGFNIRMIKCVNNLLDMDSGDNFVVVKINGEYKQQFQFLRIPALNVKKLNEKIDSIKSILNQKEEYLKQLNNQIEECKFQLQKPFEYHNKLQELLKEQRKINEELQIDKDKSNIYIIEEEEKDTSTEEIIGQDSQENEEYEEEMY